MGRTDDRPAHGYVRRELIHGFCQSKIGKLDRAVIVNEDIIRLDIAVNQLCPVPGIFKRNRHRFGDEKRAFFIQPSFPGNPFPGGLAVNIFHYEKINAVVIAGIVNLDDIGMPDFGRRLGLVPEP